jgi:DNA repair photolyase
VEAPAQRLPWATVDGEAALPGMGERVTHPEFRGVEFVHVRAKSLLNHVPAAAGMPFEWTINTYRGCTHACTYCLAPETPILLADGRTRPISEVRVGDRVYGTVRQGRYRRYVTTEVRDHWRTVRPAFRVTLADGTTLVTSPDHRFLTERGWRHVADAHEGQRPHLTTGDRLRGTGADASVGGLRERPRSFHTVGTAITRERGLAGRAVEGDADLRVVSVEDLRITMPMYDITTGTGDFLADGVISHNCFARPTHRYLELDPGREFESVIVVKVDAVERLRAELRAPRWGGHHVALGTNTDPYQRCEGRYRLTRGVVETLATAGNPFSLLTKGTLVTRDLDVLSEAADRGLCTSVSLSIPTLDEEVWRLSEPGTPHPRRRLETVRALHDAGIPTGVMVAPIMPGLSDGREQLDAVVRGAIDAGASSITPIVLHLRPGVRELVEPWLAEVRPELLERYRRLYRGPRAVRAERERIVRTVRDLVADHGGVSPPPRRARRVTTTGHDVRTRAADAAGTDGGADATQLSLL